MGTAAARLVGTEWEDWANRLLSHHYGPADYQRVPSKDRGDAGLEGYSISERVAFQCYGCEEPIGVSERYEKQRNKMTEDVGKFINNKTTLQGIFKPLQMTRWVLFVPIFDSKEIAAHAAKKTQEVIDAGLPYVASDFRVVVVQESSYSHARDQLLSTTPSGLKLVKPVVSDHAVNVWSSSNDGLVGVLQDKLSKLPAVKTDEKRDQLVLQVLKWYLAGQELLKTLREYGSKAVVATHSLVTVREIPRACVHVLEQTDEGLAINTPPFETFGGDVQRISSYVFGDKSLSKPYEEWLGEQLIDKGSAQELIRVLGDDINEEMIIQIHAMARGKW